MGKREKTLLRKQEVLSNLYHMVIEEGFENVSVNKVARKMGIQPSLIVHYFESKERMVGELIDYLFGTYSRHLIPDLSQSASPAERLQDFLEIVFGINWDGVINNRVFFTYYTLALRQPEIAQRIRNALSGIYQAVRGELERAGEAGVIPEQDWDKAAEFVLTVMEGANLFAGIRMFPKTREERQKFLARMVYQSLSHFPVVVQTDIKGE